MQKNPGTEFNSDNIDNKDSTSYSSEELLWFPTEKVTGETFLLTSQCGLMKKITCFSVTTHVARWFFNHLLTISFQTSLLTMMMNYLTQINYLI